MKGKLNRLRISENMIRLSEMFFIFSLLVCCNSNHSMNYTIVTYGGKNEMRKTIYGNDSSFSEQILDKDSIPNGIFKEYKYGRLICLGMFLDGKRDSTWTYYLINEDGIQKIENWFNG
jgi:hypothetical protein